MAGEQKNIDAIANVMDNGVDTFLEGVEKSQVGIFNKVLASVKGLELDVNGNVKQTTSNLRILNAVRKSVENEVLNDAYIKRVGTFTNQYPAIQSLNNDYFGTIEEAFNPNRELYNQIVSKSIQTTKASLLDSGINENVINPIVRIVDDSVTTGAMYADMVDELRTLIKGDPERLGSLLRYSKQITTDALNQFNGIYNETIASDLDLEWYYYSGGKRRTSRPFCKKYAGKYFHKKEVEDFGRKKDLDGSNLCGGSSKTDLCQGRIPGTNSSSIFRFRGGYQCKHVYKATLIDSVPKSVVNRNIKKGYYVPEDEEGQEIKFVPAKTIKEAEEFTKSLGFNPKNWNKITVKEANKINESLYNVKNKLKSDINLGFKTVEIQDTMDFVGRYDAANKRILFDRNSLTDKNLNKLNKDLSKQKSQWQNTINKLESQLKEDPEGFVGDPIRVKREINFAKQQLKEIEGKYEFTTVSDDVIGAVYHEQGHGLKHALRGSKYTDEFTPTIGAEIGDGSSNWDKLMFRLDDISQKEGYKIGQYATRNADEFFAESWTAYMKGDLDKINSELIGIFRLLER